MNFDEALKTIADENNLDAEELRTILENAIYNAFTDTEPMKRAWFQDRFGDREPTLEETITAMAKQVEEGLNS